MPRGKHGSCRNGPGRPLLVAPGPWRSAGSAPFGARRDTRVKSRRGFTLIELLIVVVIIGLLATIAIPKFSNTKEKAYISAMKSDLRNLATAEEAFFYDSAYYTTNMALMNNFRPTTGVTLTVNVVPGGWSASTTSINATGRMCALFSGNAPPIPPATIEGRITCQRAHMRPVALMLVV